MIQKSNLFMCMIYIKMFLKIKPSLFKQITNPNETPKRLALC